MPVRIYDIAKKLGIESKEVLAKAKELGITGAKVPSSSLDKITAQYLEEQFGGAKPVALESPPAHEPVLIVSAPPEPPPAPPIEPMAVPPLVAAPDEIAPTLSPLDAPITTDLVEAKALTPPPPIAPVAPAAAPKPA